MPVWLSRRSARFVTLRPGVRFPLQAFGGKRMEDSKIPIIKCREEEYGRGDAAIRLLEIQRSLWDFLGRNATEVAKNEFELLLEESECISRDWDLPRVIVPNISWDEYSAY